MADEHIDEHEEENIELVVDDVFTGDEDLPVVEDVIVEVAFGDPEDDDDELERTFSWVESFSPGVCRKQVADLLMSGGDIHIILDKLTVTVPMMELFRLLEKVDFFKGED